MDGVGRNLVQFKLKWHHERDDVVERVKCRENLPLEENPRLAGTVDETKTILPTGRQTRIHTGGPLQKKIRYIRESKVLGSGNFGQVYKAMNVDSGGLIAVKIVQRQGGSESHQEWTKLKGEIETLSRISHVSRTTLISLMICADINPVLAAYCRLHLVPGLGQPQGRNLHGPERGNSAVADGLGQQAHHPR